MSINQVELCTVEAEQAVKETSYGVDHISVCKELPFEDHLAYLNVTLLEGDTFCVEISPMGFKAVSKKHGIAKPIDTNANEDSKTDLSKDEYFETIYAFLSTKSPKFRDQFAGKLKSKLEGLQ